MREFGLVDFITRVELFIVCYSEISEASILATVVPVPCCMQILRNTESVIPAIVASRTLGSKE